MRRIITLSTFVAGTSIATACSCFGPNTFCGVLNPPYEEPEWWIPDAVVMAIPLQQHYYGIDVVIVQVFQGEMNNDTVRVWGDNGALCRLYTGWNQGDTLILGLDRTDLMGNTVVNSEYPPDLEREEDYMISGCGVYLLDFEGGLVVGHIDEPVEQTMSLEDFTAMVEQCTLANGIGDGPQVDPIVVRTLGAVPSIEWRATSGPLDLVVNDSQGRAVFRKRWDGTALMLDGLAPGAYVVEVRRGTDRFVRKLAVM
ncbi:MAG: hypothetical protein JNM62_01590 [Flavobacteriales bacterium]|nr:hypothetical protein [Flavobacteriales bacterium]